MIIYKYSCFLQTPFTFAGVLQSELDGFISDWNMHKIRHNSLADCPSGTPEDLYDMPAYVGG